MKQSIQVFYKTWCLLVFITPVLARNSDAATATPVPVFQVTPPSDGNIAVTSQPQLYHDSSIYESKSSAERHLSIASWNSANNSLREASLRHKSNQQQSSTESSEQKEYFAREYNVRTHREDVRGDGIILLSYFHDSFLSKKIIINRI